LKSSASITAKLGRALAVVKVTSQLNENTQFWRVQTPKTITVIKIKSGTNEYIKEGNPQPAFGKNWITGVLIAVVTSVTITNTRHTCNDSSDYVVSL